LSSLSDSNLSAASLSAYALSAISLSCLAFKANASVSSFTFFAAASFCCLASYSFKYLSCASFCVFNLNCSAASFSYLAFFAALTASRSSLIFLA